MASNYRPSGTPGGLINSGFTLYIPAAGSDDAALLQQQVTFAALCRSFVASATAVRNGIDVTNQMQVTLLNIIGQTKMTLATAQSYFPNVRPGYWSSGVIDYKAALVAMQAEVANF